MTKMTVMPLYDKKKNWKSFSRTTELIALKLSI